jgi:hypothetical protein
VCLPFARQNYWAGAASVGAGRLTSGAAAIQTRLRGVFIGAILVCTENLIRVDDVMESPKLAE